MVLEELVNIGGERTVWGGRVDLRILWMGKHRCIDCAVVVGVAGTMFCGVEVGLAWLEYVI